MATTSQPPNTAPRTLLDFPTALSPTLFTRALSNLRGPPPAPWGVPSTSRKPQYPASLPPPLRELISLIPLQPEPIGPNIRPLVASICSTFTPGALSDIAALLAFMPRAVLKDLANVVAGTVRWCWLICGGLAEGYPSSVVRTTRAAAGFNGDGARAITITTYGAPPPAGTSFTIGDLEWGLRHTRETGTRFLRFVRYGMRFDDYRLARLQWSRPLDEEILFHLLTKHVQIQVFPEEDVRVKVVMERCVCPEFRLVSESDVREFVKELPPLIGGDVGDDEACGICLEEFKGEGEGEEVEEPVRLECGHVVGRACLLKWLTGAERKTCPLCRFEVDIPERMAQSELVGGGECHLESLP